MSLGIPSHPAQPLRPAVAFLRSALVLAGMLMLVGCNKQPLYTDLDQRQANEIVTVLLQHGIAADRTFVKGGRVNVDVDSSRFADAVTILNDNGLPRREFATLCDVFKRDGLVTSPAQERAQMICALSQELSKTVSEIDGVLSARVHLVLPENEPLRQQLLPSSASVFVRHRASMDMDSLIPQIKMLVANGVAGLSYDKVQVVPVQAHDTLVLNDPPAAGSPEGARAAGSPEGARRAVASSSGDGVLPYGVALLVVVLGGAFVLWRHRYRRVYPLPPSEKGKSP